MDSRRRLGRDFWLYFGGQVGSQLGSKVTLFALPLVVYKLTGSATNLALTTVSEFLPYLLFGLILGAVVDRVDRKRWMIGVDLARGASLAALPILAAFGLLRVEYIYLVGFVQSTLGIVFDSGEFAAIPSLVATDDLVTANGRILAVNQGTGIVGPALAGALVAVMAPVDLLYVDAASFGLSALTLAAIRASFNAGDAPAGDAAGSANLLRSLLHDVREGLAYVWHHPVLRAISIMMALINFFGSSAYTQLVLFAKRVFAASDQQVGWLFAAGSAGVVLVGLSAGWLRRRMSFPVVALGALVVSGLCMTAMAYSPWFWLALLLWAANNGFGLLLNVNTGALRQAIVPNHLLGRIMSIAGVLAWSAIPLGALAGAAVIRATGDVAAVYAGMGLLTAAIAAAFAFSPIRHGERYLAEATAAKEERDRGDGAPAGLAPSLPADEAAAVRAAEPRSGP
jgi:MFS family permease